MLTSTVRQSSDLRFYTESQHLSLCCECTGHVGEGNLTCYPSWPGAGQCGGGAICQSGTYKFPSRDMCGGGTAPGSPMPSLWEYAGAFNTGNMVRAVLT